MTGTELTAFKGLSEAEAQKRILEEGLNELPRERKRSILSIAFGVLKEPMFLLLLAGGTIYLLLGDPESALMLLFFVFVIMGLTIYQEERSEKALAALRDLSSPRALVVRDGVTKRIPGREVARGDLLILSEGDRVPADAVIRDELNLQVDESLLTGESVPVRKSHSKEDAPDVRPGGDDSPMMYSGTMVVSGKGMAHAVMTGTHTELGKIGKSLVTIDGGSTYLQKEIVRVVKYLSIAGLILCTLVVIVYGFTRGDFLEGFLAGITLAMAILPEEFPVVLAIFMALGAWRISKSNVLTRRMSSIETLGSAQVLCVDKTGTLTMNAMEVGIISDGEEDVDVQEMCDGRKLPVPERFHPVVVYSILSSQIEPFDPMEKAIIKAGSVCLGHDEPELQMNRLVKEYPLTHDLMAMSRVWEHGDDQRYMVGVKGAPEAIFDLCHLDRSRSEGLSAKVQSIAGRGYRVLGVAKAITDFGELPQNLHDIPFEFVGFIGLIDPVRPGVKEAIKECYEAGIRVVMITGDYPVTARHIAQEIGLKDPINMITGPEIDTMSDEELMKRLRSASICARVVPEQKLRIVNAFKDDKKVVAMTGDGVNDSPALRSADIGVAMGARGTDVARESSSLVLLDDNFGSIVHAVRLGRRIFDNLKKAMSFIISVHIPIAGLSLLPVLMDLPLILFPVHILFLELMIDPACSLVYEGEPEERGIMKRPPRKYGQKMLSLRSISKAAMQGIIALLMVFSVYAASYLLGATPEASRALSFATLVFVNLGIIFVNRSLTTPFYRMVRNRNKTFTYLIIAVICFLIVVLYIPPIRDMFQFELMHWHDILIAAAVGLFSLIFFDVAKNIKPRGNP
jgi:Ca2+-transporting ATPase